MNTSFENVPIIRIPGKNSGKKMKQFMSLIEEKYQTKFSSYSDFHRWSVDNLAEFWAEFWDHVGVIYSRKYDKVIDLNVPMDEGPEWFPGALLNYAENLMKYRDDRTVLILAGEDKETRKVTFKQMYEHVQLYASAFRKAGVKKGEFVACYISNREEPVFAMLAAVSIGAIFIGDLPFLGSQAVLNKLKQVNPKILLTIDRFMHNRQEINLLDNIKEIVDGLPSLEQVLIVPSKSCSKENDISCIKKSCFLEDFLQLGLDEWGNVTPLEFEQVSFSHPVTINFTSGTTGLPKLILHGCGALFPTAKNSVLQLDCDRDSIWFSTSPVGWVTWHTIIAATFCGVGVFLFEGFPYFLSPTYFWDLVDTHKITHLCLGANVLNRMEKLGYAPSDESHLSSLKACISAGSIVKPKDYDFMYTKVKKDIAFAAGYGATEIMGTCMSLELTTNVYRGEIPALGLGNDVQCVNEKGEPVEGEYGNIVIAKSCPNFFLEIWGDSDRSIARKNYFSKFPGKCVIYQSLH